MGEPVGRGAFVTEKFIEISDRKRHSSLGHAAATLIRHLRRIAVQTAQPRP